MDAKPLDRPDRPIKAFDNAGRRTALDDLLD
jgi:hypothetical protein